MPSDVKRAVHARDGEQCAFVSEAGVRCPERGFLELDHRTPVAQGGQATVANTRLLCKAHNQYEAERIFGAAFMHSRRTCTTKARPGTATAVMPAQAPAVTASADGPTPPEIESDALLGLRGLGFSGAEARTALTRTAHLPAPTLEQRLRVALAELHRAQAHRCSKRVHAGWPPGGRLAIALTAPAAS